ncbi:MAG: LysR family transcriptional regulator [Eubacterium sp.]|nr:LysR family transcriptional regulator [Eubacterium sp.]
MTTQQMNYLITTVECLNMTEAAEKLNMTQSALSRSISALETELSVQLFVRDKGKRLRLTAEGTTVYKHLLKIYKDFETMLSQVDKVKKGLTGRLVIGFMDGQMLGTEFKAILDRFCELYPEIEMVLVRETEKELIRMLQKGKLDIAVMLQLQVHDLPDIVYSELFWLPTYMIAQKDHPMVGRDDVSIKELKDETFVYVEDSEVTRRMVNLCLKAGFTPNIHYVKDVQAQSLYLELGKGIAGYNAYHSCYYSPNTGAFRVNEIADAEFVLAWNKNNYNPAIALLNKTADEM